MSEGGRWLSESGVWCQVVGGMSEKVLLSDTLGIGISIAIPAGIVSVFDTDTNILNSDTNFDTSRYIGGNPDKIDAKFIFKVKQLVSFII